MIEIKKLLIQQLNDTAETVINTRDQERERINQERQERQIKVEHLATDLIQKLPHAAKNTILRDPEATLIRYWPKVDPSPASTLDERSSLMTDACTLLIKLLKNEGIEAFISENNSISIDIESLLRFIALMKS